MDMLSPATALIGQAQDAYAAQRQTRVASEAKTATIEQARETAKSFEGLFVGQMLQHMWTDLDVNPEFGGGHGEEVWRSMLIDEYGKEIAKSGGIGVADHVMAAMLKAQEQRDAADAKLTDMGHAPVPADGESPTTFAAAVAAGAQMRR